MARSANVVKAPQDSGLPDWARDFSLRDRVVLITGAGQGIGRELARQFAAAGAFLVVAEHGRIDVLINNAGILASLEKRKFELIP